MTALILSIALSLYSPNMYYIDYNATVPECIDDKKYKVSKGKTYDT